jgi:transglutaminase-like putative cysteine protease
MTLRAAGGAARIVLTLFVSTIYSDEGHGWTGYWLARR